MAVTIRAAGQVSKRRVIGRTPTPDRFVADARAWLETEYAASLRSIETRAHNTGAEVHLELHPAAPPVVISAFGDGRVTAAADSSSAGPGYHTYVARLLERLGEELDVAWSLDADGTGGDEPDVGRAAVLADRAAAEREHLALLARVLGRAAQLRQAGVSGIQIGTRPGTQYQFEGAIATPMGPRDDGWLAAAARDPRLGHDIRPWWLDATDARYLFQRALTILWTEIRWRPPADDAERAVVDEALGLLRRALPSDPSLPYPWREWNELIALRGLPDPIADRVARHAATADPAVPLVGYRRSPVRVSHEGWVLEVPGTFAERRTREEWTGGERGRQVTFAATSTRSADGIPMAPERFLARVMGEDRDLLQHREGALVGRARMTTDATSGLEVAVLEGFSATIGHGAGIRVVFEDANDWRWAVDLWRSLRPA